MKQKLSWARILIGISSVYLASCATTSRTSSSVDGAVTVRRHDTLNSIARKCQIDWKDIVNLNPELRKFGLREGQELKVPSCSGTQQVAEHENAVVDDQGDDEDLDALRRKRRGLLFGPSTNAELDLVFPVEGGISSRFGKRGRRLHKGIDIVANVGTPIIASGHGEVIFAGKKRGYGATVVIDHGQYMTLYAHASKLIARTGDRVRQGDFIAKVGRTGNARGAHLHFELRDSSNRPLDPELYLKHKTIARGRKAAGQRIVSKD